MPGMSTEQKALAYAKINLSLEVLGKREDGYHELVSVMQTVSLADRLQAAPARVVTFTCSEPQLQTTDNLVVRAATLLRDAYHINHGCSLHLLKRIPAAAGLGGGSSDAATALHLLVRIWNLDIDRATLSHFAAQIGSDVPFFLTGGTSLVEGRGERVTPLLDPPLRWYVLAKPQVGLSTAAVFRALPSSAYSDGAITRTLAGSISAAVLLSPPDVPGPPKGTTAPSLSADNARSAGLSMGARAQGDVSTTPVNHPSPFGRNSLQETAFLLCPEASSCFRELSALADREVILSGSGPTSIALVENSEHGNEVVAAMRSRGYWAYTASSVTRGESVL
jgi:4-diphosphocytidyl-2-C-methyl-D-erythritol kinase